MRWTRCSGTSSFENQVFVFWDIDIYDIDDTHAKR